MYDQILRRFSETSSRASNTRRTMCVHRSGEAWQKRGRARFDLVPEARRRTGRSLQVPPPSPPRPAYGQKAPEVPLPSTCNFVPAEGLARELGFSIHYEFPSELCRRRRGMFTEVARLVPPGIRKLRIWIAGHSAGLLRHGGAAPCLCLA